MYGRTNLTLRMVVERKANKNVRSGSVVVMWGQVPPGVAGLYGRTNLDQRVVV